MDPHNLRESVDRESTLCKSHFHRKNCIFETVKTILLTFLIHPQKLTLMVIVPVLGGFPMYRLTVSQARKTNQKSLPFLYIKMLVQIYRETFVNKWTDGCKT